MDLKYIIFFYIILLIIIYIIKPNIFTLNVEDKKRKTLYLIFLVIIIAIISFYLKVLYEWFF
jgi:hypothetical protein